MKPKALVSWSGGKDCMLALWHARAQHNIAALLTTVTREFDRISMHGVRVELLRRQAASLGIPLTIVEIPHPCVNEIYEQAMHRAWIDARRQGINRVICGDLFLEDVRRYREDRLFGPDACVFPLWHRPTREVAHEFINLGFHAALCCVDTQALPGDFAGREFAEALRELPAGVDPCGENGEFHTFVHAGPLFQTPIGFTCGEVVLRKGRFSYCDLVPLGNGILHNEPRPLGSGAAGEWPGKAEMTGGTDIPVCSGTDRNVCATRQITFGGPLDSAP